MRGPRHTPGPRPSRPVPRGMPPVRYRRIRLEIRLGLRKMEAGVHGQLVTYQLAESGISNAEFIEANQEFAEMMKAVPGLLAKIWLKDPAGDVLRRSLPLAGPPGVQELLGKRAMGLGRHR